MTVSTIKKSIDQEMQNLTPAELAKYIVQESRRLAELEASGEEVTEDDKKLEGDYNKYVLNRDIYDYAAFWRAMHDEERKYWGEYFLENVLPALIREQALIGLVMLEMVKQSRLLVCQKKSNHSVELKLINERISDLLPRYRNLDCEIKFITHETELWDRHGLKKPDLNIENEAQLVEDYVEEFIKECEGWLRDTGGCNE